MAIPAVEIIGNPSNPCTAFAHGEYHELLEKFATEPSQQPQSEIGHPKHALIEMA